MEKANKKILIVDDLPRNLRVLANILRLEGFDSEISTTGDDALHTLSQNEYDLVLLDIMMPEMDGFELCRLIKENPKTKDIPVIFLTAVNSIENIQNGFEAGAIDYIVKPFQGSELVARIRSHIEIKEARENLQKLNATKDRFFSIIAHDLKNPISAFKGTTDILLAHYSKFSDEERLGFIKQLNDSSKYVFDLLQNLLSWSQTQTDRMTYNPDQFPLKLVVENLLLLIRQTAALKDIELIDNVEKKHLIYADVNMIATVIRNVVSNAIKFTPNGGVVEVRSSSDGTYIQIDVIDNGIGIATDDLDKLFAIESNFSTQGTNNEHGTGLGLILCKEFVEKNSGNISVTSEIGKGTTFSIRLLESTI